MYDYGWLVVECRNCCCCCCCLVIREVCSVGSYTTSLSLNFLHLFFHDSNDDDEIAVVNVDFNDDFSVSFSVFAKRKKKIF